MNILYNLMTVSRLRVDPYWNLWRHVKAKNTQVKPEQSCCMFSYKSCNFCTRVTPALEYFYVSCIAIIYATYQP